MKGFLTGSIVFVGACALWAQSSELRQLKANAEAGDAHAQNLLGEAYHAGKGVPKNAAEAAIWYRKAAEQGDANAQLGLAVLLYKGEGVRTNAAEAIKWFLKSADQGDRYAQCFLGTMYDLGEDVPKSPGEALKWYRKAADQGLDSAQFDLGEMYAAGRGIDRDYVEAFKWLTLAGASGHEKASVLRDKISKDMTSTQIAEGQRRSAAFATRNEARTTDGSNNDGSPTANRLPSFTGSGFFVTRDGYLLTSSHVVQRGGRLVVRTKDATFAAKLARSDKANDVALLKISGTFRPLPVTPSGAVKLGDSVFTIGFPNILLQGLSPKITKGEISSLAGALDDPRHFQISVAVQPGNSGGPLVNEHGNVVGIVASKLSAIAALEATGDLPENVNYAVKSSVLSILLESLPDVSARLLEPHSGKTRPFEEIVREVEAATALVLVYDE